ncbi:unnamed protein product [Durusdinium trenchii]|uniref:Uncharacterized protein n=1 Tax=Durusdinium trenchii TaxID=1381693 RepID=A0ABP0IFV5_9DINO
MALRYFLAIPVKAWQEMKADYEREIPVRMKRPVFSADPESAALASMCNRAPQLGLSVSMQHKRQPRKLAAELYTESLVLLSVSLSESGATQGHKLRMLNDTLQLHECHFGPDMEGEAQLGLMETSICTCEWWPATLQVASTEETVLKSMQSSEETASWTLYMLVSKSESDECGLAPLQVGQFMATNTKDANPEVYKQMAILFSSQHAAVITAVLQSKNAKLQVKVMEIKVKPEVLRKTEVLKFTQITRFESTLCDHWLVNGPGQGSAVLPLLLDLAVFATTRVCMMEISAGDPQPLTALNSGRDEFELQALQNDALTLLTRLQELEEEKHSVERKKKIVDDLIRARAEKRARRDGFA